MTANIHLRLDILEFGKVCSRAQHKKSLVHPPNHVPNPWPPCGRAHLIRGWFPSLWFEWCKHTPCVAVMAGTCVTSSATTLAPCVLNETTQQGVLVSRSRPEKQFADGRQTSWFTPIKRIRPNQDRAISLSWELLILCYCVIESYSEIEAGFQDETFKERSSEVCPELPKDIATSNG